MRGAAHALRALLLAAAWHSTAAVVCFPATGADWTLNAGEDCSYGAAQTFVVRNVDIQGSLSAIGMLNITATGNFTLGQGATINMRGKGYGQGGGPYALPTATVAPASGGPHAGCAHSSCAGVTGVGRVYGSTLYPTAWGTAGASALIGGIAATGGAGGGAVRLDVAGNLTLLGIIDARGSAGSTNAGVWGGGGRCVCAAGDADGDRGRGGGSGSAARAQLTSTRLHCRTPPFVCVCSGGSVWITADSVYFPPSMYTSIGIGNAPGQILAGGGDNGMMTSDPYPANGECARTLCVCRLAHTRGAAVAELLSCMHPAAL